MSGAAAAAVAAEAGVSAAPAVVDVSAAQDVSAAPAVVYVAAPAVTAALQLARHQ